MASHAAASAREAAAQGFDPLSDVLRTVRLSGAMFFMVEASDPWGIEVPAAERYAGIVMPGAQHVVSYHLMLEGTGWVRMPGLEPARFSAGDVLVFAHSDPYQMLSAPDRRPELDAEATVGFFREMAAGRLPFVVEEGGGGAPGPGRTARSCRTPARRGAPWPGPPRAPGPRPGPRAG